MSKPNATKIYKDNSSISNACNYSIRYECNYCHNIWVTKDLADECSNNHIKPINIKEFKYDKNDRKNVLPASVILTMSDGKDIPYFRSAKS